MSIRINLDVELAKNKMSLTELSERVGGVDDQPLTAQNRQGQSDSI